WLPTPSYVRASAGAGRWRSGFHYLWAYFQAFLIPPLLLCAGLSIYRRRERGTNRLFGYALLVLPVFWLYVASVGGDFIGLYRFALPVVPLLVTCASLELRALLAPWPAKIGAIA